MKYSTNLQDVALLLLRLVIAAIFLYVGGYGKLFFWTSPPPEGMPTALVLLMKFLSIVEPIGAIALIAGFLTRWASMGLAIIMIGAIAFLRLMAQTLWFTSQQGSGIDYVLLILAGCFVLMTFGPGAWSVDASMGKK